MPDKPLGSHSAAKAASKEQPNNLEVAPPLGRGSQLALQAGKELSSQQQLLEPWFPPANTRQHSTHSSRGQIVSFIFSFKFLLLLVLEYHGLCLCGGLLLSLDDQSHSIQGSMKPW